MENNERRKKSDKREKKKKANSSRFYRVGGVPLNSEVRNCVKCGKKLAFMTAGRGTRGE